MKNKTTRILLSVYHYICFFLLMAFIITCCMLLFLSTLSKTMGIVLNDENTKSAAILTFLNVVFLSLVCTAIDAIRRKFTVDRHVRKIVAAAEKISKGDFSVRIPPLYSQNRVDGLDEIVSCFNKMAEELSGIEEMQSEFSTNVSHELKTPLAIIKTYAELLSDENATDSEKSEYTVAIAKSADGLSSLVSNILRLSKLECRNVFPAVSPYSVANSLGECIISFDESFEKKGVMLYVELDEDVKVCTDPELLSIVWNNLISNALKFTENGGSVTIKLKSENGKAVVSVRDTGCGMDKSTGQHIFDKFYQGDTSHKTEGNGLGLALVKRICDIVDGDISVESEKDKGTCFTVSVDSYEEK